jgi:hypothetical protein
MVEGIPFVHNHSRIYYQLVWGLQYAPADLLEAATTAAITALENFIKM